MMQVRICERLGVKFPGPTRQWRPSDPGTPLTVYLHKQTFSVRVRICLKRAMNRHGRLLDHLVGASEEGGWDRQTDFLSGLQIDDQFEPCRLLDGQLGRFPSFEDFRNIVGRHHHHLRAVRTVGDETAPADPNAEPMQDWEPLFARKLSQELRVGYRALLGQDDEAIGAIGRKGGKDALDVFGRAELNGFGFETQLFRELDSARRLGGLTDVLWVVKDHEAGRRRQKFAEHRHALRHELGGDTSHAREIAAWTSKAHDEAGGDRVAGDHDDRNGARSVLGGYDRLVADSHDDIHFRIDEFAGEARELPGTSFGKAVFHRHLLAFGITELPHPVLEMSWRSCAAESEIPDFRKPL